MPPRRAYMLILTTFLLCSLAPLCPCALASSPAAAQSDQITFIVYLQEQTDLTPYTTRTPNSEPRTPNPKPQTPNTEPQTPNASSVVEALQATAARTQPPLQAFLDKLKDTGQVTDYTPFWIFNGFAVTGDMQAMRQLAARPEVAEIRTNRIHHLPPLLKGTTRSPVNGVEWNVAHIAADAVWKELDITGAGVVVASMDSGVDWTHPALRSSYRGAEGQHDYHWYDATATYRYAPADGLGHGTHTVGTMVGADPGGLFRTGIAPGAQWIAVKIFDDSGSSDDVTIHRGFQWLLAPTDLQGQNPDPSKAPDVVNNSWGSANGADPAFWPDVAAWRAAGICAVFSAGNSGGMGEGTVGSPGSFPHAFAVGATDFQDQVAFFSSRGPSFWEEVKPEISAPGVDIRSTLPGGGYGAMDGTSMAAPHVSGLAALLLQADPTLTPDDLEHFLQHTAVELGEPGADNDSGWGRVDAYEAVRWALSAGRLSGRVIADTGLPLAEASVVVTAEDLCRGAETQRYGGAPLLPCSSAPLLPRSLSILTDAHGYYAVSLPAAVYTLRAQAFGYQATTVEGVEVFPDLSSVQDLALASAPTGPLSGRVTDAETSLPLLATVSVVGAPRSTATDPTGIYTLTLPAGTHTIQATSPGHRPTTAAVTIAAGEPATRNLQLATSPAILLVDADAWAGLDATPYYAWALRASGYPYDTRRITDLANVPTAHELSAYDVVLWAQPEWWPGRIDSLRGDKAATEALQGYLQGGGRLFISGQKLGYDASEPYYDILHVYSTYLSGVVHLRGTPGDLLEGVSLTLNDIYALKNQITPYVTLLRDPLASSIVDYVGGGSGGVKVQSCDPACRAIYLSFGYEAAGPRADQIALLDRALQWLAAPASPTAVSISPTWQEKEGLPGRGAAALRPTLITQASVVNGGQSPDRFTLTVEGNAWPAAIWDEGMTTPITRTAELAPCQWQTVTISVTIPADAALEEADTATLRATSTLSPTVAATATLHSRALPTWAEETPLPMPRAAHATVALGCEVYAIAGLSDESGPLAASTATTVYDTAARAWSTRAPKPTAVYNFSAALLDGLIYAPGGANSPQEQRSLPIVEVYDPLADSWSQVSPLPVPLQGAATAAAHGKLYVIGGWDNTQIVDSVYAYDPATDTWAEKTAMPGGGRFIAAATVLDGLIYVAGGLSGLPGEIEGLRTFEVYDPVADAWTTLAPLSLGRRGLGLVTLGEHIYAIGGCDPTFREIPFAFVERYDPASVWHGLLTVPSWTPISSLNSERGMLGAAAAGGKIYAIGGLSWGMLERANEALSLSPSLCASTKTVDKATAAPGQVLTYTLVLRNPSDQDFPAVRLDDPIPAHTAYLPGSVSGGATYDPHTDRITWSGEVAAGRAITFTFGVTIAAPAPPAYGGAITNAATVDDGQGATFVKRARTTIQAPSLATSRKQVDQATASAGQVLLYTITLTNSGATAADVTLHDPLPPHTTYVENSVSGGAVFNPTLKRIEWRGELWPTSPGTPHYTWRESDQPGGPAYQWEEISATGSELSTWSEARRGHSGPIPIGFSFPFFGATYDELFVGTDGYVSFGQGYPNLDYHAALPNPQEPNNAIMAFGAALERQPGLSHVYVQQLTAPFTAGAAFVVEYVDLPELNVYPPFTPTFQIILYPSGEVQAQYKNARGSAFAAAGMENAQGTEGVNYPGGRIHDELAVRYLPPTPPTPPQVLSFQVRLDEELPPQTSITNTAIVSDGLGLTYPLTAANAVNTVDLSGSTKEVDKSLALPGHALTYTITLRNRGSGDAQDVRVADPIPEHTVYTPHSASGGALYNAALDQVEWQGSVPAGGEARFAFAVTIAAELPPAPPVYDAITNTATISDGQGNTLTRQAATTVRTPDLRPSYKQASSKRLHAGDVITYTLRVINAGAAGTLAGLADPIPAGTAYLPGSAWASRGEMRHEEAGDRLVWSGFVPAGGVVTVRFAVRILEEAVIVNRATISDELGVIIERRAIVAPHVVYLPWLLAAEPSVMGMEHE